jgi:hypothetical protein
MSRIEELIYELRNGEAKKKHLLVDDLNDLLDHSDLTDESLCLVISTLAEIVPVTADSDMHESFFNLLFNSHKKGNCERFIENIVVERMPNLDEYSLVHAISLLSESQRPDRNELLLRYANHSSEIVRQYVRESLP